MEINPSRIQNKKKKAMYFFQVRKFKSGSQLSDSFRQTAAALTSAAFSRALPRGARFWALCPSLHGAAASTALTAAQHGRAMPRGTVGSLPGLSCTTCSLHTWPGTRPGSSWQEGGRAGLDGVTVTFATTAALHRPPPQCGPDPVLQLVPSWLQHVHTAPSPHPPRDACSCSLQLNAFPSGSNALHNGSSEGRKGWPSPLTSSQSIASCPPGAQNTNSVREQHAGRQTGTQISIHSTR